MNPRVSVVMAVKDMPLRDLGAAIYSIMKQTMRDFEFIIVDYGSGPDCLGVLHLAASTDPRILVIEFPHRTFTEALNVGVATATGEFIARQDADDLSHPQRLERQLEFFEEAWMVDVLGTGYRVVDTVNGRSWVESFEYDHYHFELLLRFGTPIAHGTLMARSVVFDEFQYDNLMVRSQDYGLYLNILNHSHHPFYAMPDVLYTRWHTPTCVTEKYRTEQRIWSSYARQKYGGGSAWRHRRLLEHAFVYWRTPDRIKRWVAAFMLTLYDYRYWLAQWHKAKAKREYHGYY